MKTLFKNFILLDGTKDMEPKSNLVLVMEKERIIFIGENYEDKADIEIDLKGQYLLPGLINLHVHIPGSGSPKASNSKASKKFVKFVTSNKCVSFIPKAICKKSLKEELYSGVTTLRAVGGVGHFDSYFKQLINKGKFDGPTLYVSDYAIGTPGGHMTGTITKEVTSKEEILTLIEDLAKNNVDYIKLMITGGIMDCKEVGHPGDLRFNEELVKYAVDVAHSKNLMVSAHVEGTEGMNLAIKVGIDTIEHTSDFDKDLIYDLKNKGITLIPTFSPAIPYANRNDDSMECVNSRVLIDNMISNTKFALENNIPLGSGNDVGCPYVKHYNFYLEPYYLTKHVGLTNKEALNIVTLGNAKILGAEKDIGSIEEGKFADMLVVKDNPLDNLLVLKDLTAVIKHGKVFTNKIKKDPKVEEYLKTTL